MQLLANALEGGVQTSLAKMSVRHPLFADKLENSPKNA